MQVLEQGKGRRKGVREGRTGRQQVQGMQIWSVTHPDYPPPRGQVNALHPWHQLSKPLPTHPPLPAHALPPCQAMFGNHTVARKGRRAEISPLLERRCLIATSHPRSAASESLCPFPSSIVGPPLDLVCEGVSGHRFPVLELIHLHRPMQTCAGDIAGAGLS